MVGGARLLNTSDSRLLIAALAGAAAAPYLFGGPVWDDHSLIYDTLVHLDGAGLAALWSQPVGGTGPGEGYYRPLAMTVLSLTSRVGIPLIHLCTALLHTLSALILLRLLRPLPGAVPAAALFAVHPIASEVLGWASALPDALSVSAALLATIAGGPIGAAVATLCGLLSKESAILVLPAVVAAGLAPRRLMWGWLGAVGFWVLLRMLSETGAGWSWADRIHLVPAALLWPVYSMIIPHPLTAVRDLLSVPGSVVVVGAGILLLGLFLGRRSRPALAGVGLMIFAALIALPPTLDGYFAAERYAYMGLIGLSIWTAAVLPVPGRRFIIVAAAAAIGLHIHHSSRWAADIPLFSAATRTMPTSSYAWHLLGHAFAREGHFSEAADAFGEAILTGHPYPDGAEMQLIALVQAGRAGEALVVAEAGPQDGLTANWIAWWARAAHDTGQHVRARTLLEMLYDGQRWDGPDWVPELAAELQ